MVDVGAVGSESRGLKFTGDGRDYARVWYLNLFFTLVTIGLFAPWARVRKLRYLCSQLQWNGVAFAFDGKGWPIFLGRLALGLILASWFLVSDYPWVAVLLILLFIAVPYLLVLRFRHYTSHLKYGDERFSFSPRVRDSYGVYGLGVLTVILSLFSGTPIFWFLHRRFVLNHTSLGVRQFAMRGTLLSFLKCYVPGVSAVLLASAAWVGLVYFVGPDRIEPYRVWPWLLIYALPFYFLFLYVMASINARLGNFFWNHTDVGTQRFVASFDTRELFGLYVQNSFWLLVTVGLYWPWAQVALYSYRAERVRAI